MSRSRRSTLASCLTILKGVVILTDLQNGEKFGRLTVVRKTGTRKYPYGVEVGFYLCQCDCGNQVTVRDQNLRCGNTKSCGCLKREKSESLKVRNPEVPTYPISFNDSINPKFVSQTDGITVDQILKFIGVNSAEEALRQAFPFWWEFKARTEFNNLRRAKDGYMFSTQGVCDLCGCSGKTVVHHIIPLEKLGGNEPYNLVLVCRSCHKKAHNLMNENRMDEYYNLVKKSTKG